MKANDLIEKLKCIGSILVVVAAACIMVSGAMQYLVGVGRLVLWIGIVLAFALALALFTLWLRSRGKAQTDSSNTVTANPEGNGSADKGHLAAFIVAGGVIALLSNQILPGHAQGVYLKGEATKYALIPKGSTFEGRIDKTIGSSASQQGEIFKITLSSPVLSNGQDVVIPAGTEIIGEVVEAIPSKTIPHPKNTPPVTGKLRTQLTSIRTPEGTTFPLVASLAGELVNTKSGKAQITGLGTSKGYVGTAEELNQVGKKKKKRSPNDRRSGEATGEEDETVDTWSHRSDRTRAGAYSRGVLDQEGEEGTDKENANSVIRSLVKRNGDLFIFAGSPLTIRLNAPFKIAINRPMEEIPDVSSDANNDAAPIIPSDGMPSIQESPASTSVVPANAAPANVSPANLVPESMAPSNAATPKLPTEAPKMTNSSGNLGDSAGSQLPSASPGEIIPAPGIIDDKAKLDSQMKNSSSETFKQTTIEQVHQLEDKSF